MCSQQKSFPRMVSFLSIEENLFQQMKDIEEKSPFMQTWEASSFSLKMVPSPFGKPAPCTFKTTLK